jgi:hypothetical protein
MQTVLERLVNLLQEDDSEAQSHWEVHASALHLLLPQAGAVEQAINGFDFEEALRLLRQPV